MTADGPAGQAPLLAIEHLSAFYGPVRALDGVSMSLSRGTVTALLGANGAGKTTLLRACCGMVRTTGARWFDGDRVDGWTTDRLARAGVAHVPEGRGTFAGLTVEENLRAAGLARRAAAARTVDRVFADFPRLAERRHQRAGQLSGGEQQMLAIGRALMLEPRVLLLDEPSFGLAPQLVRQLFDVLAVITRRGGVTTLIVEQRADLALELANRAVVLETGRLVFDGTADEVRRDGALRRSYLGVSDA
jgi:branched-chain amino acid transport system ATP-binding protein